jgi:hypothetical protein
MAQKNRWILVTADRGIPSSVTFFERRRDALTEEKIFRSQMNPDYEDSWLFEVGLAELLSKRRLRIEAD